MRELKLRDNRRLWPGVISRLGYMLNTDLPLGWPVLLALRSCDRILDVGVGPPGYSWLRMLGSRKLFQGVGLDVYQPYLLTSQKSGYWGQYVRGNALTLPFDDKSFDACIALDVIEHVEKSQGYVLINEMKRVSARRVVVMTPNGFLPQAGDANPTQKHLSGWGPEDFERMGFTVFGIRGLRRMRGEHAIPTIQPIPLGLCLSLLFEPLAHIFPQHAYQLLAVSDESEHDPLPTHIAARSTSFCDPS